MSTKRSHILKPTAELFDEDSLNIFYSGKENISYPFTGEHSPKISRIQDLSYFIPNTQENCVSQTNYLFSQLIVTK